MFGFSFSELVVLVVVGLVVVGPKELPKVLRKAGQWAGKLRRMAADLRAQSGIDDVLRAEGIADDLAEIRKLARGELDQVQRALPTSLDGDDGGTSPDAVADASTTDILRRREYPKDGADAYGALPDDAVTYDELRPPSALARDPLYVTGDPNGELPPEPLPSGASTLPGIVAAAPSAPATAPAGELVSTPSLPDVTAFAEPAADSVADVGAALAPPEAAKPGSSVPPPVPPPRTPSLPPSPAAAPAEPAAEGAAPRTSEPHVKTLLG